MEGRDFERATSCWDGIDSLIGEAGNLALEIFRDDIYMYEAFDSIDADIDIDSLIFDNLNHFCRFDDVSHRKCI